MDKYMLCLANSYKHGGRCIAGVEVVLIDNKFRIVRDANNSPKWVRPISHNFAGEVPNEHARFINVLSIIKITGIEYAGMYSHSEDVYYQSLSVHSNVRPSHSVLNGCLDNFHSTIFGNKGKALTPDCFQRGDYSVMLVRAVNPEVYVDTRFENPKPRMKFIHNGNNYDFPITDPIYLDRIKLTNKGVGTLSEVYLVLSLGVEHEGWHSKLIAAIIEPQDVVQKVASQTESNTSNSVSSNRIKDLQKHQVNTIDTRIKTNTTTSQTIKTHVLPDTKSSNNTKETITIKQKDDYNTITHKENKIPLKEPNLSAEEKLASYKSHFDKTLKINIPSEEELATFKKIENAYKPLYEQNKTTKSEGCYIATAVYGSYDAPEVIVLRKFRDNVLKKSISGRLFISTYYSISPYIATKLKGHYKINNIIRGILDKFILYINSKEEGM